MNVKPAVFSFSDPLLYDGVRRDVKRFIFHKNVARNRAPHYPNNMNAQTLPTYSQQASFTYQPVTRSQFASNMGSALWREFQTACAALGMKKNQAHDQATRLCLQWVQMPEPAPADPRLEALKPIDDPIFWDAVDSLRRVWEAGDEHALRWAAEACHRALIPKG